MTSFREVLEIPDPHDHEIHCPSLRAIKKAWEQPRPTKSWPKDKSASGRKLATKHLPLSTYRRSLCVIDAPDQTNLRSMRFRQVGTEVNKAFGRNHTGRRVIETYQGDWSKLENQYRVCLLTKRPHLSRGRLPPKKPEGQNLVYEKLLLPYSKNSQSVNKFLAIFTFYSMRTPYFRNVTLDKLSAH